jgi:hypothetical protein
MKTMMERYILCCFFLVVSCASAFAESQLKMCAQATVRMPSVQEHAASLEGNTRYGKEVAQTFRDRAKTVGKDYLEFQIYFLPEYPGGSGWFDINNLIGVSEAKSVVSRKSSCGNDDYPLLIMIGIRPDSIKNGALYVHSKKGSYTSISLKSVLQVSHPVPMRLNKGGTVVCPDIRAADFNFEQRNCSNLVKLFE